MKILIIGAGGQLGSELTTALRNIYGQENVIATDVRQLDGIVEGPSEILDATDKSRLFELVKKHQIDTIYHLAAILSAKGEQDPNIAWDINMSTLLNVLDLAKESRLKQVYWPSSIAVFGPDTPKDNTPQKTVMSPTTVYGISKLAGERWCHYYYHKYGVDVRSLRYPGLIGYKAKPGGGTTDYAVDIFYKAVGGESYDCFLKPDAQLPMMYMDDAIRGTIELMQADASKISIRASYNITAMSFTPQEIYEEVKQYFPDFKMSYSPDFRQQIADSWPGSIDDSIARADWGWKEQFHLTEMAKEIITNLKPVLG